MPFLHFLRKAFLIFLFMNLLVSCRLGETLSEADPDTKAEVDSAEKEQNDTIVPRKDPQVEEELR